MKWTSFVGLDSHRVLDVLVRNLEGMVFRCSIDDSWTMLFISSGCLQLTGYSPDELRHNQSISYEDVTHPEDRDAVRRKIVAAINAGRRYIIEYRICCKDGNEKWVKERGQCVKDELGHDLQVSCSIGVSVYPGDGGDLQTLLRHADSAMYSAKQSGKGQYQFFTSAMNIAIEERMSLESELRRAVEAKELKVFYQMKVDSDGRPRGCEALVRWTSLEFGVVSPARFIPLAEEIGLIGPITDFVLHEACREAASWSKRGFGPLKVAVNLSAQAFKTDDLPDLVATVLSKTGLSASQLELEITESMLIGNTDYTVAILERLKTLGVSIAIDDFGTGYSSLAYLKRFPLDVLKIDRSFVMGCERGGDALAIPRAIISLGHSLGLKIVAEGVENLGQLRALEALGCELFQGFLIARPLDAHSFNSYLLDCHTQPIAMVG